jgi:hypothetical protein
MSVHDQAEVHTSARRGWRSLLFRTLTLTLAFAAAAATSLVTLVIAPGVASAAAPVCTFTGPHNSGPGSFQSPIILTGVTNGASIGVSCTGLPPGHTIGTIQASPLAVATQPFSLSTLGNEADINDGLLNGVADPGGHFSHSQVVGTGGNFKPGLAGTYPGDPKAVCPPSQAQINAGLGMCLLSVADVTATAGAGPPTSAAFAGIALLDFSGQGTPCGAADHLLGRAGSARPLRDASGRPRRRHLLVGRWLVGRWLSAREPHPWTVRHPQFERVRQWCAGHQVCGDGFAAGVLLLRGLLGEEL